VPRPDFDVYAEKYSRYFARTRHQPGDLWSDTVLRWPSSVLCHECGPLFP
jgi:hypothetical protein